MTWMTSDHQKTMRLIDPDDPNPDIILRIRNIKKQYPIYSGVFFKKEVLSVKAVDGISFDLKAGETLGIVGETGCGKTTLAKIIARFEEPTSGEVWLLNSELGRQPKKQLRARIKDLQLVFQSPGSSLDPRQTVMQAIMEPLETIQTSDRRQRYTMVRDLLLKVGLGSTHAYRYPHELSLGQQQRVEIARALTVEPKVLILDEPVSSLDSSVRASIINMLIKLQDEINISYLFIAHDLAIVRKISHRVMVLYLGRIMEIGSTEDVYGQPAHPYTQALMSAIPNPDPRIKQERIILKGEVPTPIDPPLGCRFCTRCRYVRQMCLFEYPKLEEVSQDHFVSCHFAKGIMEGTHLPIEKLSGSGSTDKAS